jgi:hypothetical protein
MEIFETQEGRGAFFTQPEKRIPQTRMRSIQGKCFFIN